MKAKVSLLLLLFVALVGCKTTDRAAATDARYLSAKVKLSLPRKGGETTVSGTLRMLAGEQIQLSFLVPMVRNEAVRIEMTPQYVLVIDRMDRVYVRVAPQTINRELRGRGIYDYRKVEQLLRQAALKKRKTTLSARDLGLLIPEEGRITLSGFSRKQFTPRPVQLSARYTQVTWKELLNMLSKQ
jgi:hypothetical protein